MPARKRTSGGLVTCFGTGPGWPSPDRNHSSFLYSFGSRSFILDCGEALSRGFLNTGLSYNSFDRIILSHTHADHVGGLFMFMQGLWLKKRTRQLSLHLPADAIEPIQRMLATCYVFPELCHFEIEWIPLTPAEPIQDGPLSITPYSTTHLDGLRQRFARKYPQSFTACSFLLESPRGRVGHSADIGAVADLEPLLELPLDLLVCELAHCTARDLFRFLRGRPIRHLLLTHLGDPYRKDPRALATRAREMLPGIRVSIAEDGQQVAL